MAGAKALTQETEDVVGPDLPTRLRNRRKFQGDPDCVTLLEDAASEIEFLASERQSLSDRIDVLEEILRGIIGNANEAPRFGPFDQIDNSGSAYQSEAFAAALERGRAYLARASLRTTHREGGDATG